MVSLVFSAQPKFSGPFRFYGMAMSIVSYKYEQYRKLWRNALLTAPPFPENKFAGKGIVFSSGGEQNFVNLWVNLCLLRRVLNCRLPIEIWHFGEEEMTASMRALLQQFDVNTVDGAAFVNDLPRGKWRGFALKTLAVIHSRFAEVFFLDVDSYPVRDPSFLFEEWPYRWAGACFWPDVSRTDPKSAIWSVLDMPFVDEMEWESGQMLIDKRRAWRALMLLEHLTKHFPFYYRHVYGDKMLFYAVWKKLDQPYAMTRGAARLRVEGDLRTSVDQLDFDGELLFHHRATADWKFTDSAAASPSKSPHDSLCREFLIELDRVWPASDRHCSPNKVGKPEWMAFWSSVISGRAEQPAPLVPSARGEHPKRQWDAIARQALLSPSLATPRLMGKGIEALRSAKEDDVRALFRFFAALIFVDPRLTDMLPDSSEFDGTELQDAWDTFKAFATTCLKAGKRLSSVRGNLFNSEAPPELEQDDVRLLQLLTDNVLTGDAPPWPEWFAFWRGKITLREEDKVVETAVRPKIVSRHWQPKGPTGKVLVLSPIKDAADLATDYCQRLARLTYPSDKLSIGLLESDSRDDTFGAFDRALATLRLRWRRVNIWKHDYRYKIPTGLSRWDSSIQFERRQILAQSRNELLQRALEDEDWVLWLDADVIDYPPDIIEQLLSYGRDILHPHCVLDYGGQTFDRNAWRDKGRVHMESLRGRELLAPLDAVGGTMLFIRADVHRRGLIFPAEPYGAGHPRAREIGHSRNHPGEVETEGLGIMAMDMQVQCWGLPELEILHRKR